MELMKVTKVEPKVKPKEKPKRTTTANAEEGLLLLLLPKVELKVVMQAWQDGTQVETHCKLPGDVVGGSHLMLLEKELIKVEMMKAATKSNVKKMIKREAAKND